MPAVLWALPIGELRTCWQVTLKAAKPEASSKGKKGKGKGRDVDLDEYLPQEPQAEEAAGEPTVSACVTSAAYLSTLGLNQCLP